MNEPTESDAAEPDFAAPGCEPPCKVALRQLLASIESDERWAIPRISIAADLRYALGEQ